MRLFASIAAGLGLVWLMRAGGLPVVPDARAFDDVDWPAVALFAAIWLFVLFVRSVRWHFLLEPIQHVPLRSVLTVSFIGLGALVLLPLRTGELVRPTMIRAHGHVSGWAAAGTIAAERVVDGLFLSALLFAALRYAPPIEPLPDHIGNLQVPVAAVPAAAYAALAVFGAAFVTMGLFYWRRDFASSLTRRAVGLVSPTLAARIATLIEQLSDGLKFLPRVRYAGPFVACTAAYWFANCLGVYVLLHACGLGSATIAEAMTVLGILALGLLTPNAPGLFGTFQLSLYAGLAMFFTAEEVVGPGAVFVFLLYVLQLGITLIVAAVAWLLDIFLPARASLSVTSL